MNIYEKFAYFYEKGSYLQHSKRMAELLPAVLEKFDAEPQTILDMACGEGTFAVAMAKEGFQVTGVDLSPQMLQFARKQIQSSHAKAEFILQDIRSLPFEEKFDLVTCWYDSLNYLLKLEDLEKTFAGVWRALRRRGLFIFDMNTIHGLAVNWQRHPCNVQQDTSDLFEIHFPSYDFEKNIATLRIVGFMKESERWARIDEEHKERGYSLEEVRKWLKKAGLKELACWGNLQEMSDPGPDSGRVWFVMQK